MTGMLTYARVDGGVVQEDLIYLPPGVLPSALFDASQVWVDVTAVTPAPTIGQVATDTAGVWSFAAPVVVQAPVPVPAVVSLFQLKIVLAEQAGGAGAATLLDAADVWIVTQPAAIRVAWSDGINVARTGGLVTALTAQFSWASAAVDGYFVAAAQVPQTV